MRKSQVSIFHIVNGIRHDYIKEPLNKTHIAVKFAIAAVLGIFSIIYKEV